MTKDFMSVVKEHNPMKKDFWHYFWRVFLINFGLAVLFEYTFIFEFFLLIFIIQDLFFTFYMVKHSFNAEEEHQLWWIMGLFSVHYYHKYFKKKLK